MHDLKCIQALSGRCGLDVPWGGCLGSGPRRAGLFPWLRCVAAALGPCRIGKAEQRLDWAISKVPGSFLTSWGSSLPSALLAGGRGRGREKPGNRTLPLGAGRARPCRSAGRRGCGNGRLLPHPQWRRAHTGIFSGSGCLVLIGLSVLSEGRWGRRVDGLTGWMGPGLCWCPAFWSPSLVPCTLSWPLLLVLWA